MLLKLYQIVLMIFQEKKGKGDGQLQYQIKLYQIFQGICTFHALIYLVGVPHLYDYGVQNDRLFMIIDLLSYSLEDLFQICQKHFTLSTVIYIGMQIVTRLQYLHRKGFIHRDIKANNFMVSKKEKNKVIYIIDFGLSKRYKDIKTGLHIVFKGGKSLVGTARYASIASHQGFEQCRRDDLQSLGYLLLYFILGKLPWQGIQIQNKIEKYAQIGRLKKEIQLQILCTSTKYGESNILVRYFNYIKKLSFEQQPDYDLIRKMFKQQLIRLKQQPLILDWQKIINKKQLKYVIKNQYIKK